MEHTLAGMLCFFYKWKFVKDGCQSQAQHEPNEGKLRTDDTQQVAGNLAVIPHLPAEPDIDNQSYEKFVRGYDDGAAQPLEQEGSVAEFHEKVIHGQDACAAGQHHGPVGVTAEQDLKSCISNGAQSKNYHIHDFIMCGHCRNNRGII